MRHKMTADGPIPFTPEEEAEWDAMEFAEKKQAISDARRKAILSELQSIDLRSVRPIREGNQPRIAELEMQAVALRAELAAL